ncbi:hypothetical protein [Egicoccus sp. AB-alg2]|uniref:hypothetical protein n=1 Tax=Egicoccus sp. AB-alg2 TaxID=3242693 RepID=UPI00359CF68D
MDFLLDGVLGRTTGHRAGRTGDTGLLRLLTTRLPMAFDGTPPASLRSYDPPGEGGDDAYAHLADTLRPHLDAGHLVLAVLDERAAEPLHARLLAVRSAMETTRLVVHTTALPPLGAALLVRALAELDAAGDLPASVLASGVSRLERTVLGAAWLRSVARLQHPAPPLKLHARSYLPRAGFAAVVDDQPRVVRHRGADHPLPLPPLEPATDWRVVVGTGLGDVSMVEHTLATVAAGAEIVRVPNRRASATWWGTDDVVELACMPRSPSRLRAAVLGDGGTTTCTWCGEVVAAATCPLCGALCATASPAPGAAS